MFQTIWKRIGTYKTLTFLTPFFVLLEVASDILLPLLIARLIDQGIDGGDLSAVWKYGLLLLGAASLSLLFGTLSGWTSAIASSGLAKNLRHDMFYKVQEFSFSNIDHFSTSSIVTRLTTDVTNVQNAFRMVIRIMIRAPFMLLLSVLMVLSLSPRLAMIFLLALPILGSAVFLIVRKAFPAFEQVFQTYDKLNNVVQENLRGIRVVKSYVREQHESEKFEKTAREMYDLNCLAEKTIAFAMPAMQLCMYMGMIALSWLGARMVVGGTLSTGDLTSVFSYSMQILMSLMMVAMVLVMITMSRASARRIAALLEERPDLTSPDSPLLQVKDGSISFRQVDFSYAGDLKKPALSHINLTIRSGETIGILGSTGSGKSSLIQLIPRLYDVTAGSVLVGGEDVRSYRLDVLRDAVSMVLQKNLLFSGTIRENLLWGNPEASEEELDRVCRLACADEFLSAFPQGYDTELEQGGANLSGGQRQRLCIARALLKKPKVLILDDSTSAVDTRTDASIRQAFREELPSTTKLIIAQRISSLQDADRILILENGRISDLGTHEELLQRSQIYQEVYASQTKGGLS